MHVREATIPGEDFEHAAPFAPSVRNAHSRVIRASIDRVRPWIAACWTGTDSDPFPRDFIRSWRKNPPGEDLLALVPNVTRVGHGAFSFRFVSWDGERFRVRVESAGFRGWHGFDLRAVGDACEVTHTLEVELSGAARGVRRRNARAGERLRWYPRERDRALESTEASRRTRRSNRRRRRARQLRNPSSPSLPPAPSSTAGASTSRAICRRTRITTRARGPWVAM